MTVKQRPALLNATVTPLASIFGSGFLVIVPILAGAVGSWSVLAMAGVCGLAFAVGEVVRFNIRRAEPVLAQTQGPSEPTLGFERLSDLALVLAYVISVCLYLRILASFVLGATGHDTNVNESIVTTVVIVFITTIGLWRGLQPLEFLEKWALAVTLLIIALLIVGFGLWDFRALASDEGITLPSAASGSAWEVLTILAGTLIVVQGFETTRYLGNEFDTATRVTASRWSQIIATGVYLVFVALALPLVHLLDGQYDDNSLIRLAGFASALLVAPLVLAAALSQFSAAVADTLAATGIMDEVSHGEMKARYGYLFVGIAAIALTWSADTYQILALASRAFAFYYLLQCLVAISVSHSLLQRLAIGVVAAALAFITIFAVPAG